MTQTAIPFLLMRGGTSRGPYMDAAHLPADRETLAEVLVALIGAGHPLTIDGLGGGAPVTTKVAILSRSEAPDADIDYLFAQVGVEERVVDFAPTCGNILVGVGPAAIEMGLFDVPEPSPPEAQVRIRAVNTEARATATVRLSGGRPRYDGDVAVDGVPGTAAPVDLAFTGVTGGVTGAMFPSGARIDVIAGIETTLMDVAMPMMIARAADLGLTGGESAADLDADRAIFARLERMRLEAGRRMGLGDVSASVTPKIGLVAPPAGGGHARVRYFMPWRAHPTLAVTGSQCLAACLLCPGTVGAGIVEGAPAPLLLEHPMGTMAVTLATRGGAEGAFEVVSAGVTRTARLLARGEAYVPAAAWPR